MWFIGVEVEQETSAPPPKKYPGSAPAPRKSQFHIFHMSVKMYIYLNMWALIHLLCGFLWMDGGHCPNEQPKNFSRTFFSKRSSLATYIVDCMAMGNEQVYQAVSLCSNVNSSMDTTRLP